MVVLPLSNPTLQRGGKHTNTSRHTGVSLCIINPALHRDNNIMQMQPFRLHTHAKEKRVPVHSAPPLSFNNAC